MLLNLLKSIIEADPFTSEVNLENSEVENHKGAPVQVKEPLMTSTGTTAVLESLDENAMMPLATPEVSTSLKRKKTSGIQPPRRTSRRRGPSTSEDASL